MRNILSLMTITGLVLLFGCQTASSSSATQSEKKSEVTFNEKEEPTAKADSHEHETDDEIKRISLEDAKTAFDKGEAVFVDTRSSEAFVNEHIKGAINIPWKEIENRYKEIPKDKTIIVYCS